MEIKSARFISSFTDMNKLPKTGYAELAFIGRSNVGKSSLINMLTGNGKLAKTSQSPGKTQTINHFLINDNWYLVDLPGYGFAKVSKDKRGDWEKMIRNYLLLRETLMCVFVLVDCRLEPQAIDLQFINWLGENHVPLAIAFTKADKLSTTVLKKNLAAFEKKMMEHWEEMPPSFITSAEKKTGKPEMLQYFSEITGKVK